MKTFLGLGMGMSGIGGGGDTSASLAAVAVELPPAITPTVAGLSVGAFVAVVGFITVLLVANRRRPGAHRPQAPRVVIPAYGTLQRDTPLPPAAFNVPGFSPPRADGPAFSPPRADAGAGFSLPRADAGPEYARGSGAFRPSTSLSARAFAKMYAVDPEDAEVPPSDPEVSIDWEEEEDVEPLPSAAVSVSAIVMVEGSADKSAPHPLGVIPSSSPAMQAPRPASFADLELDDGVTEIAEPYFDEPPRPDRRTDAPRIRPVAPAGPRFPIQ